jgi:arylsulfatase A-like enzyme
MLLLLAAIGAGCRRSQEPVRPVQEARCVALEASAPARHRDVVFILSDTLRRDRLGAYGGPARTPRFDRFAAEGLGFTAAFAPAPWTKPAIASLFTGLRPAAHGVVSHPGLRGRGGVLESDVLAPGHLTLAEALAMAGYRTAAFVSNPWLGRELGFGQGFEIYDDSLAGEATPGEAVTAAGLRWLRERPRDGRPFFLYLHYMDAHDMGGNEPRPGQSKNDARREAYARALRSLDDKLRFVIRTLGLDDGRTLVLVTADHGEEFLDHGGEGHWNKLYEELIRVPLVAYWPGRLVPARVSEPVASIDILPTLREAAGAPASAADAGVSLLATLRGEVNEARTFYPMRWWNATDVRYVRKAVVHAANKYIVGMPEREEELYDLAADPQEKRNLVRERPQLAAELRERLRAFETSARVHPREFAEPVSISREQAEELKALGYVQ